MVIDTSAILAILQREPESRRFLEVIESVDSTRMSVASFVESSIVIESRYGAEGLHDLDRFTSRASIELIPVLLCKGDDFVHTNVPMLEVR
jgi:ribonuclease VapC